MRVRPGVWRVFFATVGMTMLVLPVGAVSDGATRVLSIPSAFASLATGHLGVGLLSAFGQGDELAAAALMRIVVSLVAWIGFAVVGVVIASRAQPVRVAERRHTCHACGFETSKRMGDCPSCGARIG